MFLALDDARQKQWSWDLRPRLLVPRAHPAFQKNLVLAPHRPLLTCCLILYVCVFFFSLKEILALDIIFM